MKYKFGICICFLAYLMSACASAPEGNLMRDDEITASMPAPQSNIKRNDEITTSKPTPQSNTKRDNEKPASKVVHKSPPIERMATLQGTALRDDDNKTQFQEALNLAKVATDLAKSAKSEPEWKAVANQWNQAIELMKSVPKSDPNYQISQQKTVEYQSNLKDVQKKIKM